MFLESIYLVRLKGMKRQRMADLIFLDGRGGYLCQHKAFKNNWEDLEKKNWRGEIDG